MKRGLIVLILVLSSMAFAAQSPRTYEPIRIPVRSADPWTIVAMLEGRPVFSPEMSTILALTGAPQGAIQAGNALFSGGKLVVNPTDNSIWFYPDRTR